MRFVYLIMFIVILAISFSGCKGELTASKVNNEGTVNSLSNEISVTSTSTAISASEPSASSSDNVITQEEVIIKASLEKPLSLEDKDTIFLKGLLEGEEYIEVIVNGEIMDFEQIAVVWDESANELKEKETIKKIEKLKNQTLVIKTYQTLHSHWEYLSETLP